MSSPRTILVTGATGKQGRSVIDALLSLLPSSTPIHILALVRDPTSPSSLSLSSLPSVTLLPGDLNSPSTIFTSHSTPIWGVYSVQINSDQEITQGKALIDAAITANVQHFVYASGDRGGPERSAVDSTNVKNFAAKFEIEKYLQQSVAAKGKGMTFTILRPVSFFENQSKDVHGKGFARMWMQMGEGDRRLQMVSVRDVGWFGAQALVRAEEEGWRNKAVGVAGDELSAKEAREVFREVTGQEFPMAPCLVGKALKNVFLRDTVGVMFAWFEEEGFGVDVSECKRLNAGMLDYRAWLKEYSGFV